MKRSLKTVLTMALLLGLLSGCGRSADETTAAQTGAEASATEEAAGETGDQESDSSDPDYSLPDTWAYMGEGPEAASALIRITGLAFRSARSEPFSSAAICSASLWGRRSSTVASPAGFFSR